MTGASKLLLLLVVAWSIGAAAANKETKPSRNQSYAAIAHHAPSQSVGWATERRTSREARIEALKQCGHAQCVVVGTVTRGCAALATSAKASVLQKGVTEQEAQTKALAKCGAGCEIAAWTCTR